VAQILVLVLLLALSVGGIALLYVQPLSILICRYVETRQVDCQLQERIAWVIPVREIPIPRLKEAYVDRKTVTRRDEDRESDTYGKEYTVDIHRVILISASGEIGLSGTDEIGISAKLTATRINSYLNTPTDESLTVWGFGLLGHALATLGGGLWFIVFAFAFVVAIVDMVFGPDTVAKLLKVIKLKRAWSVVVWIKDIVVGLYQKVERKRSAIFGLFFGAWRPYLIIGLLIVAAVLVTLLFTKWSSG
jgi:hypothetical protein